MTAFGGALLIISLILLNNTIRLAIFSRRYLINTFKLVGATKGYIMRPFLGAAAKQGVWAGVTASLLFGGSIAALSGTMPEITASTQIVQIAVTVGGMILCGVVISLLFTAFAVNKFVDMKSNKIFYIRAQYGLPHVVPTPASCAGARLRHRPYRRTTDI